MERTPWVACSFCGKSQTAVKKIIAGPNVFICNECIDLCNEIIIEESAEPDGRPGGVGGLEPQIDPSPSW